MEHISKIINIFLYIFFCLIWVSLNVLIAYCARDLHLDCMLSACCLHAVYILSTCCLHISLLWMHLRSVELLFLFGCCRMLPPRSRFFFFSQWPRFGAWPQYGIVRLDRKLSWTRCAFVGPSRKLRNQGHVPMFNSCSQICREMFCFARFAESISEQRLKEVNSNDPSSPASR